MEHGRDHFHYNSALYLEDGRLVASHRKGHLPTYGMFDEGRYFAPGNRVRAIDTKFGRAGVLICEDAWHPVNPYILSQDGAEIAVCDLQQPGAGHA